MATELGRAPVMDAPNRTDDSIHAGFLAGDRDSILQCVAWYRPELTTAQRERIADRVSAAAKESDE
jgi:hypothetical protein